MARKIETPRCDVCNKSSIFLKDNECMLCPDCYELFENHIYPRILIVRIGMLVTENSKLKMGMIT